MDLSKISLPDAVIVDGKVYPIHTDFQFFVSLISMLKTKQTLDAFDFMYKEQIPEDRQKGLNALVSFAYPKRELPRIVSEQTNEVLFDYGLDAELIYSSFYQQYKIDLFQKDLHLHWHKFIALFQGLQDTKLTNIIEARSYIPSKNDGDEYKKAMLRKKEAWRIEEELTDEEKKAVEKFDAQLKKSV